MIITVVGSGNIAHALIACMHLRKNDIIQIFTSHNDYQWKSIRASCKDKIKEGKITIITHDPSQIIPQSDMILLTIPAFLRKKILQKINPYISNQTLIGSFPGVGGFDDEIKKYITNKHINYFSSQRVPYIARIKEKGQTVQVTPKDKIYIAVQKDKENVKTQLENLLTMDIILLDNFLEVSLSNSNPILHAARLYSLFLVSKRFDKPIYFYREWDDDASEILLHMDAEFMQIVKALGLIHITSLETHYEVQGISQMTHKIKSIDAFKDILAPMQKNNNHYSIDVSSRYFTEDIGVGLQYIKNYATKLDIQTPIINNVYTYLSEIMENECI